MPVLKSPMIASHRTRMAQLENSNKQLAIDSSGWREPFAVVKSQI